MEHEIEKQNSCDYGSQSIDEKDKAIIKQHIEKHTSTTTKKVMKCVRKGSRVCYSDLENLVVTSKVPDWQDKDAAQKEDGAKKEDSVHSGESVYKSLSFERVQNEIETHKCLAFWKSVMEKNLEPIKCTLIQANDEADTETLPSDLPTKKTKGKQKKESSDSDAALASEIPNIMQTKMFKKLYEDVKKKNLDKMKMMIKQNCKTCELMDSIDKDRILSCDDKNANLPDNLEEQAASKHRGSTMKQPKTANVGKMPQSGKLSPQKVPTKQSAEKVMTGSTEQKSKQDLENIEVAEENLKKSPVKQRTQWRPCACVSDPCECKHDLVNILKKLGKGPCVCGMAQCTCRENLHVPYNVAKEGYKESEPTTDKELPESEDGHKKGTTSTSSIKTLETGDKTAPSKEKVSKDPTKEKSITSFGTTIYKSDQVVKSTSCLDKQSSSKVKRVRSQSDNKSSSILQEQTKTAKSETASICEKNTSQVKLSTDKLTTKRPSTKSDGSDAQKTTSFTHHPEVEKKMKEKFSCESVQASSITMSESFKCACGFADCDCDPVFLEALKPDKKLKRPCVCGCGHARCKCDDGKSIAEVIKQIEGSLDKASTKSKTPSIRSKSPSLSRTSSAMKNIQEHKKSNIAEEKISQEPHKETSKAYQQSGEMRTTKQKTCLCGFSDCDCDNIELAGRSFGSLRDKGSYGKVSLNEIRAKLSHNRTPEDGCSCGFADCDCCEAKKAPSTFPQNDTKERYKVLTALKEKLKQAEKKYNDETPETEKFVSAGVQCSNIDLDKVRERKYCYICGHYDCPCEVRKLVF